MELQYRPVLNQGNEAFNVGQSISAEEAPRGTVSYDDIASHMHEKNRLIPVELAKMVLEMQPEVEMHFIAQGFRVPRYYQGKQISQAYADVKLKKNISLAAVQAIDPSIQTLTKENIRRFVKDEDLVIRYKVETEQLANDWLAEEIKKQGKTMVESGEKAYIARKENQGGSSQGGGNNGNNPDDGMLG